MPTNTDIKDFQSLINDSVFPQTLLQGDGAIDRLQDDFVNHPVQFIRTALAAAYNERFAQWNTPKGQEILSKFGLTIEDLVRNLK